MTKNLERAHITIDDQNYHSTPGTPVSHHLNHMIVQYDQRDLITTILDEFNHHLKAYSWGVCEYESDDGCDDVCEGG